jgi:S-methylmethionine-dependent homocysteine/selenocysteine methylase
MSAVMVLDGGMSRELVRLGAVLRQPEWSAVALMETPAIVQQVHEEFIAAGADVVTTNSYALVPFHLGEARFWDQGAALIALSGQLARTAANGAGRPVKVAGSLPPIFGSYEPQLFRPQDVQTYLTVLVDGLAPHVDLWLGETLSLIAEAEAVRVAIARVPKPLWISFTLDDAPGAETRAPTLRSGEPVADAALWAARAGIDALLFNCSRPEVMADAVRVAAATFADEGVATPIGVYANAFVPGRDGAANETLTAVREDLNEARYNQFACDWVAAGATLIGGCCGVGARHIHGLAQTLRAGS